MNWRCSAKFVFTSIKQKRLLRILIIENAVVGESCEAAERSPHTPIRCLYFPYSNILGIKLVLMTKHRCYTVH